ncbi:MAG: hypothetical protein LBR82_02055 [Desulfovibrio sp.]|jgi:hypothetical protein|nr:hypothetical protein [Desulfovibrio sp.]
MANKPEKVSTPSEQAEQAEPTEQVEQVEQVLPAQEPEKVSTPSEHTLHAQEQEIAQLLKGQRKVKIMIQSGRTPSEQCPVALAVNGREFLIKRDVEVEVPEAVVNVLRLAVEQQPIVDIQPSTGEKNIGYKSVARFPFHILAMESDEQMNARLKKKTKAA